jgi:acyl dehydratase
MSDARPAAGPDYFWEDYEVGVAIPLGSRVVTKDEILRFAAAFDPQPLHLDEEAARHTMVGRLCASGWHSCALAMRLYCDGHLNRAAGLGASGVKDARFFKPVFPGDTLSATITCLDKRPLRSRPGVGLCETLIEMSNQSGEKVLSWQATQFFRMRGEVAA